MTPPLPLGIYGASGRMGQALQLLLDQPPHRDRWTLRAAPPSKDDLHSFLNCSVIIDFSTPEALVKLISFLENEKVQLPRLLSGTTGLSPTVMDRLKKLSLRTHVLHSPNTSLGIQLFSELLRHLPSFLTLTPPHMHLSEVHHAQKKDSPSGTALFLKKKLEERDFELSDPISSVRQGEEKGTHTLKIAWPHESFTLEHHVTDRSCFASGALEAAWWLSQRKGGCGWWAFSDMVS